MTRCSGKTTRVQEPGGTRWTHRSMQLTWAASVHPQWSYAVTAQGRTIQPKAAPSRHSSLRRRLASHHATPRQEDRCAPRGSCASHGTRESAVSLATAIIGMCAQPAGTTTGLETALAAPPPAGRHNSPTGAWEETGAKFPA